MNKILVFLILINISFYLSEAMGFTKNQHTQKLTEQLIEQGDDYFINHVSQKIWIENPKIFSATVKGSSVVIKALSLGSSKIKVDQKEFTLVAIPVGFKSSFNNWKSFTRKMPQLQVGFCEHTVCLKGEIFKLNDFIKIVNLMEEKKSSLFLKLKITDALSLEIEKWYTRYFRDHEITPPKIVFTANPWKAILSSKDEGPFNNQVAHQVGLFTQENKNKLEMSDNVKVSVRFVEVKKSLARKLGIKWTTDIDAEFGNSTLYTPEKIGLLLSAGESSGDVKTIASPNLVCRSGKEAEFLAGGEIPFKISSYKSQNIVWKEYGIKLKIKPKIDPLGQMSIEIDTEVSTPDFSNSVEGLPTIHRNKVSSHFDLVKSKTIVISGLIQNSITDTKDGIAFLTQIPILGRLFSSQNFRDEQTELMIFMTPEIYE